MKILRILMVLATCLAARPVAAAGSAAAFLEPGPSMEGPSAATVLAILKAELEKRGLSIVAVPGYDIVAPAPAGMKAALPPAGVDRAFVLGVNPLGQKLVLSLAERAAPDFTVVFSERMTAANIEEVDTVLPRLVESVLARKPAAAQAGVTSVTTQEARPMRKKAGDLGFGGEVVFGAPMCAGSQFEYGLGLRLAYEMPHGRIDIDSFVQFAAGVSSDFIHYSVLSVGGAWLMLEGNVTPYLGGSAGFSLGWRSNDSVRYGALFSANAGVEFFRLYGTHMFLETRFGFPTYRQADTYVPVFSAMLGVLFF